MRNGLLLTAYGTAFNDAFEKVKAESVAQAQAGMEILNKDFLEEGGHRLETVTQPDGKVDFVYKKLWSDEKIEEKEKGDNEVLLNTVGNNLLTDQSEEGKELTEFLRMVYQQHMDKEIQTPRELGKAWWACFSLLTEEPESEIAKTFKVLSDDWNPPKSNEQQ